MPPAPMGYRRIGNSLRLPVPGAQAISRTPPSDTLFVNVITRRRVGAQPLPDQSYWMTTPPGRHAPLSHAEFTRRFGATQDQHDVVLQFASDHGLAFVESSLSRRSVILSGTVEAMNKAFNIELSDYTTGSETYRSHEGYVYLRPEIADVVEGILGLDNRRLGQRASNGPYGVSPLTPPEIAAIYKFPAASASGQTIGILEFGGGYVVNSGQPSDIDAYVSGVLNLVTPVVKTGYGTNVPAGSLNFPDITDTEVALDIDVAASVAQGATIVVYFGTGFDRTGIPDEMGWSTLLGAAIHDETNTPSVLSISWSASEDAWPAGAIAMVSPLFQEAASLSITVLTSSGDYGSSGYALGQNPDGFQHVHYPASDPYVTACGGTTVVLNPFAQTTWNDELYGQGATGGGVSKYFQDPTLCPWQGASRLNGQSLSGRGVPDVAGNASPFSGYDLVLYGQQTTTISTFTNAGPGTFAGTSAVAPLYAGLIAIINAISKYQFGYLNPTLYRFANTDVFQDIADQLSNGFDGVPGYESVVGWDPCTGLGSIQGNALLLVLALTDNPGCAFSSAVHAIRRRFGRHRARL
jgi:subtilase family serine protease